MATQQSFGVGIPDATWLTRAGTMSTLDRLRRAAADGAAGRSLSSEHPQFDSLIAAEVASISQVATTGSQQQDISLSHSAPARLAKRINSQRTRAYVRGVGRIVSIYNLMIEREVPG
jgi:hypothetical protein